MWLQKLAAVHHQLSQAKDALQTAKSRIEALQLEAREAKKEASQAAEQLADLKAQLSASAQPPSSGIQSVAVAEVEEKIKAIVRGWLAMLRNLRSQFKQSSYFALWHNLLYTCFDLRRVSVQMRGASSKHLSAQPC